MGEVLDQERPHPIAFLPAQHFRQFADVSQY